MIDPTALARAAEQYSVAPVDPSASRRESALAVQREADGRLESALDTIRSGSIPALPDDASADRAHAEAMVKEMFDGTLDSGSKERAFAYFERCARRSSGMNRRA